MEIKPFKFNTELRVNERREKYWVLIMDEEIEVFMGDPICCQHCKSIITGKFYLCEEYNKWFCEDCQLKEGDTKQILCKFDEKEEIIEKIGEPEHHYHICIKKVERE